MSLRVHKLKIVKSTILYTSLWNNNHHPLPSFYDELSLASAAICDTYGPKTAEIEFNYRGNRDCVQYLYTPHISYILYLFIWMHQIRIWVIKKKKNYESLGR